MQIEQMQEKIATVEEANRKLERSVQELFRQNQWMSDELQSKDTSGSGNNNNSNNNNNDSLNTSLADELGINDETTTPVTTPVKASMFSDMKVAADAPQPSQKLFSDLEIKKRDDRQYRITCT
jgi:hypothetical protein